MLFTRLMLAIPLSALWITYAPSAEPQAFGRFGRVHDDGLLTLNVTPAGFTSSPTGRKMTVRFGDGTAAVTVEWISSEEKTLRLEGGGPGAPNRLRWTLLYPGFAASFGSRATFQFTDLQVNTEFFAAGPERPRPFLLITPRSGLAQPLALIFEDAQKVRHWNATQSGGQTRLDIEGADSLGEIAICAPWGLRQISASATAQERAALVASADAWARRAVPVMEKRLYSLSEDGAAVNVEEWFHASGAGEVYAPIPPVLALALEKGYPARVEQTLNRPGLTTKYGPFAFAEGGRLRYSLPLPPLEERAYVLSAANTARLSQLNSLVGHLGGSWATNAVDLGYAGMANAHMAWSGLDTTRRQNVTSAWNLYLPLAFRMPPYPPGDSRVTWKEETEPYSQIPYLWTYKIDGPPPQYYRLDIDWGNALPLYGLYKYAQYTGDWNFARDKWDEVARIQRYFDAGDDWAWMTVVNGDMGWSTGTGDPLAATFCGHVATLKMARALGDSQAERHYAHRLARVCVPAVSRFWLTEWGRRQGFIQNNQIVQGFWENSAFTAATLSETSNDPWGATNILSGDGILPELFAAFDTFARAELQQFENEYAAGYPHWAQGDFAYAIPTTYSGNSVYVTFPHIYARAILGESTAALWGYVDTAITNRGSAYWVGPNVIAELLARETPLILTEWRPAGLKDARLSADGKKVTLDFTLPAGAAAPWTLQARLQNAAAPSRALVAGAQTPFQTENGRLAIQANVQGNFRVEIEF